MHRAQHVQHAGHDAGVCGSNDRLTRQTGQGGEALDLVHLGNAAWRHGEREGSEWGVPGPWP